MKSGSCLKPSSSIPAVSQAAPAAEAAAASTGIAHRLRATELALMRQLAVVGEMPLRTAAFTFGSGGERSRPVTDGFAQLSSGQNDPNCTIRITPAGKALMATKPQAVTV